MASMEADVPVAVPRDVLRVASPAEWEMTTLRHEWLPAGVKLSNVSNCFWSLVLDGSIFLETATGQVCLEPGDAVIVGDRTAHRITAAEATTLAVADLRLAVPTFAMPSPWVVHGFEARHPGVVALVRGCSLAGTCDPMLFAASYAGLIGGALTTSWVEAQGLPGRSDQRGPDSDVAEVVSALASRPGETWTLERMAGLVHLSRSALIRRFRRTLGRSPMEVVRDVRMREARNLLRDPSNSVAHVAYSLGYASGAAFTRAFSAHHDGHTPRSWRTDVSHLGIDSNAKPSPPPTGDAAPTTSTVATSVASRTAPPAAEPSMIASWNAVTCSDTADSARSGSTCVTHN